MTPFSWRNGWPRRAISKFRFLATITATRYAAMSANARYSAGIKKSVKKRPRLPSMMPCAPAWACRHRRCAQAGLCVRRTVEFLLGDNDDFYFLEVNARLQVEHPVTEEIIGKDLVREQIRVAEGETLSFTQEDISINGHAIEARLYAENPAKGFLPSPGPIIVWKPATAGGARFDSGVEAGSEISTQFDPMIAKVIVHAPTRREAAGRLARAPETTAIAGLNTNRDFGHTLRTPEWAAIPPQISSNG